MEIDSWFTEESSGSLNQIQDNIIQEFNDSNWNVERQVNDNDLPSLSMRTKTYPISDETAEIVIVSTQIVDREEVIVPVILQKSDGDITITTFDVDTLGLFYGNQPEYHISTLHEELVELIQKATI